MGNIEDKTNNRDQTMNSDEHENEIKRMNSNYINDK